MTRWLIEPSDYTSTSPGTPDCGLIRPDEADIVRAAVDEAASRSQVHVHEVAVLSDHVHVIASFRPEGGAVSFIRHAKSESARRINLVQGAVFQWARGYFIESLSRIHVRAACAYVARQHLRHPDRVPLGPRLTRRG